MFNFRKIDDSGFYHIVVSGRYLGMLHIHRERRERRFFVLNAVTHRGKTFDSVSDAYAYMKEVTA